MRLIFVAGKGGVGKTTVAGTLSHLLSQRGMTALVSTDLAHSLGDFFSREGESFSVDGIRVFQPDARARLKERVREWEGNFFQNISPTLREDFIPFFRFAERDPSNHDLIMLEEVKRIFLEGREDFLVVDSGATAQFLKFLYLGEKLHQWYSLLLKWRKKYLRLRKMVRGKEEDEMLEFLHNRREENRKFKVAMGEAFVLWVMEPNLFSVRETLRFISEARRPDFLVTNKARENFELPLPLREIPGITLPLLQEEPLFKSRAWEKIKDKLREILIWLR